MNIKDLLGERVLVARKRAGLPDAVEELRVLEVAESGKYVKTANAHGTTVWRPAIELVIVERLPALDDAPRKAPK